MNLHKASELITDAAKRMGINYIRVDGEPMPEPGTLTTATYTMNHPGNPTENPELDRLNAEVLEYNEAIKKQNHIRWLAGVEITRLEKSLKATIKSIETITKGPEV